MECFAIDKQLSVRSGEIKKASESRFYKGSGTNFESGKVSPPLHKLPYIQVHLEGNKYTSNGSANPVNTGGSNNIDLVVINQPLASLKPKAKSKHLPMLLLAAQRPGGGIN